MKKRKSSLSLIAIAGTLVFASVTALTGCNNNSNKSTQVQKFTVTAPSSDADYTITGLASEYAPGDTVSFTVTVNNTAKKIKTVTANGSAVNGTDGKYSFSMPSSNVTLAVTLEDKGSDTPVNPTAKELKANYSGTAQVGNTLTVTATYDGDPCTSFTLTDKSETAGMISISGSTISCLKEGKAKVEVSYSDAKTTLEIDIAKDACQSLKEIYKEVGAELTTSSTSVVTTKSYTTRAVVVAIGDTSSSYVDVIFFDGETFGTLNIGATYLKDTSNAAIAVGKTYKISGKMCNYWGVFEFKNDNTNKVYMSFEAETNSSNFITAPTTPTAWTGTEFDAFKAIQTANNSKLTEAQKETGVPLSYVTLSGTYGEEPSGTTTYCYLYVDGDTTKKVSLSKTSASALGTLTIGKTYDASMFLLGYNTSYGYLNVIVDHIAEKKIAATSITINTPTKTAIDINETLDLTVTTDPVNANGAITWASSNTAIATVNDGKVTGIAAGSASITATITNDDGSTVISDAVEITVNEHVATCNVHIKTAGEGENYHGTVTLSVDEGDSVPTGEVTITPVADDGYKVLAVYVNEKSISDTTGSGNKKTITADEEGLYKFTTEDGYDYSVWAEFTANTIADLETSTDGSQATIKAILVETLVGQGSIIYDGTNYGFVSEGKADSAKVKLSDKTVGSTYIIKGDASHDNYGYYIDISSYATSGLTYSVTEVTDDAEKIALPTDEATAYTDTELTALSASFVQKHVKISGATVTVSGNYINFSVGSFTKGSITNASGTTLVSNHSYDLEGYTMKISGGYKYIFVTSVTDVTPKASDISIDTPAKTSIDKNETLELSYTLTPSNGLGTVAWASSNTDVATVSDKGVVTGVAAGTTDITVSVTNDDGTFTSAAVTITVSDTDYVPVVEVVHKVEFNSTNNKESISSYASSFENVTDGVTYVVTNMNNNKNGWNYVKCGTKSGDSTATITTKNTFANAIKKSTITFGNVTKTNLTSAKLCVSTSSDFSTSIETIDITSQVESNKTVTSTFATPTANCYYKYEFVLTKSGSNGPIAINGLTFVE